mmetsp:Transcript_8899/g.7944  ORF Transcript_8899/g.7944 Transcript_8899/m.7944 type:complete len:234 (+) Transcript_8899:27-728(+)
MNIFLMKSNHIKINQISILKSLTQNNINKYYNCQLYKFSTKKITENSWAAESLKKQGEILEQIPKGTPYIVFDDKDINEVPEHINRLVNELLSLNVFENRQFLNVLQKRLGITDEKIYRQLGLNLNRRDFSHIDKELNGAGGAAGSASAKPSAEAAAPVKEEKTSFDIKLTVVDAKVKIKVIKEVRTITGLGLKEAKELVEKAPVVIKQGLKKEEVDNFKKLLLDAGAEVEII